MTSRAGSWLSSPWWGARWRGWIGLRRQVGQEDSTTQANRLIPRNGVGSGAKARCDEALGLRRMRDNATLSLRPGARALALRGVSGTFLVTQEGDPLDHVLGPGDEFRAALQGLVVVWALSDGAIAVDRVEAPASA